MYKLIYACFKIHFYLQITGLGYPYTTCENNHETKHFANYSVPGCRIECETEIIYKKCLCKLVESPGDYPVCDLNGFDCAEATLGRSHTVCECIAGCLYGCILVVLAVALNYVY